MRTSAMSSRPKRIMFDCAVAAWTGLFLAPTTSNAGEASQPGDPPPRFEPAGGPLLDSDIAARLEALRNNPGSWGWHELLERGRLAVADGDLPAACTAFEMAAQSSASADQRVVAQYYWATSMLATAQAMPSPENGVMGRAAGVFGNVANEPDARRARLLGLAGEVLNEAQVDSPYSRDIAAGRVMAWSLLGDEVETVAAEHQLRVIDPNMEGTARSKFAAAARIVLAVCRVGRIVLLSIELDGVLEPEHRVALLELMDTGAATAEQALAKTGGGPNR